MEHRLQLTMNHQKLHFTLPNITVIIEFPLVNFNVTGMEISKNSQLKKFRGKYKLFKNSSLVYIITSWIFLILFDCNKYSMIGLLIC